MLLFIIIIIIYLRPLCILSSFFHIDSLLRSSFIHISGFSMWFVCLCDDSNRRRRVESWKINKFFVLFLLKLKKNNNNNNKSLKKKKTTTTITWRKTFYYYYYSFGWLFYLHKLFVFFLSDSFLLELCFPRKKWQNFESIFGSKFSTSTNNKNKTTRSMIFFMIMSFLIHL